MTSCQKKKKFREWEDEEGKREKGGMRKEVLRGYGKLGENERKKLREPGWFFFVFDWCDCHPGNKKEVPETLLAIMLLTSRSTTGQHSKHSGG